MIRALAAALLLRLALRLDPRALDDDLDTIHIPEETTMTEPVQIPAGVVVPPSAIQQQIKAQVRIGLAAIGGALVLRHVLPGWAVNDQTVEYAAGVVILGGAAAWSWVRARLVHTRFASIAADPRVPDEVAVQALADDAPIVEPHQATPGDYGPRA